MNRHINITNHVVALSSILLLSFLSSLSACPTDRLYNNPNQTTKTALSQNTTEKTDSILSKAIQLIDSKEYLEANRLLQNAINTGSDDIRLHYEYAWCFYCMKDYSRAVDILKHLTTRADVTAEVFQLLGNSLDMAGRKGDAYDAYRKGLSLFPNAGCLYLELGNMKATEGDFRNAILLYEEGISRQPEFASNYYRAAMLFFDSTEEVWGMAYGELFMLIERTDSDRLRDMSKRLYETYQANISFKRGETPQVDFDTDVIRYSDSPSRPNLYPAIYRELMQKACIGERHCDLASLYRIRNRFHTLFEQEAYSFENILSAYHGNIIEAGHFEAFTYWLLGYGNTAQAAAWIKENKSKWTAFLQWYDNNQIEITPQNTFTRRNME